MTTQIRLATPNDAAQIQAIYAPIVQDTFISFEQVIPNPQEIASRIEKTLQQYPYLVCDIDGQIAGYAYGSAFRTRAAYQWTTEVTVYTHPDFHRRGIGRGIYTSLFTVLREQGYCNAVSVIALPNNASVGLHESMGFEKIGVFKNMGYKLDDWWDTGWWQLELRPMPANPTPPTSIQSAKDSPEFTQWLSHGYEFIRSD